MGFHHGLAGESYDRSYSNKALLRRIWDYAKPYKKHLLRIVLIVLISSAIAAIPPVLVSRILDSNAGQNAPFSTFLLLVGAVILIEILGYVSYYLLRRMMVRVVGNTIRDLTVDAFAASVRQDLSFMTNLPPDALSRVLRQTAKTSPCSFA